MAVENQDKLGKQYSSYPMGKAGCVLRPVLVVDFVQVCVLTPWKPYTGLIVGCF